MIYLPLLLGLVLGPLPAQHYQNNYRRIVTQPDPNNGYEDYVRATDLLHGPDLNLCLSYSEQQLQGLISEKQAVLAHVNDPESKDPDTGEKVSSRKWTEEDESNLTMAKQLHDLGFLGVQRYEADKFGGALALLRAGNEKRVWDPRANLGPDTVFPELASFKTLVKVLSADAYVHFAEGNSKVGTTELLDGLTFSRRIRASSLISELVGIASQSIVLASFERHLPELSQKDASLIVKYTDAALQEPNEYVQALQHERDLNITSVDFFFKNMGDLPDQPDGPTIQKALDRLSPGDKEQAKAGLKQAISQYYDKLTAQFDRDESTWATPKDELALPSMPASINTVGDLIDAMLHELLPVHEQATIAMLKSRAQLRLLGLHARVIDFKWRNNRFPNTLKEAVPEKLNFDPLGNTAFQYELKDNAYRLYSKGVPSTGPIELKYRHAAETSGDGNGPIPPGT